MGGIGILFEYETQKIVQINSTKVGVINRVIQLLIIGYFICYVMIYERGYQATGGLISAVTTKVKGVGFTNITDDIRYGVRSWDVADYVHPPQDINAFFVMTNLVSTPMQSLGKCRESDDIWDAKCKSENDCPVGDSALLGNGIYTGKCLRKKCEVYAWCPPEVDELPIKKETLFPMVENYTVLLKNDIEFPMFNVKRRNVLDWSGKKFLYKCRYQPDHPEYKYCPIITLKTIFKSINASKLLFVKGGTIGINVEWNCNLDWDIKYCNPEYSFRRLDNINAKIAKGLNFRYANYYRVNGTQYRDLNKVYGIRFLIFVGGKAGKFSMLQLTMNLGSGLALLGLASVLCDIIVLHLLGSKDKYRNAKFETVENEGRLKKWKKKQKALKQEENGAVYSDKLTLDSEQLVNEKKNHMEHAI